MPEPCLSPPIDRGLAKGSKNLRFSHRQDEIDNKASSSKLSQISTISSRCHAGTSCSFSLRGRFFFKSLLRQGNDRLSSRRLPARHNLTGGGVSVRIRHCPSGQHLARVCCWLDGSDMAVGLSRSLGAAWDFHPSQGGRAQIRQAIENMWFFLKKYG